MPPTIRAWSCSRALPVNGRFIFLATVASAPRKPAKNKAKLQSHAASTNCVRFSGQQTTFIYRWYGPTFLPSPCHPPYCTVATTQIAEKLQSDEWKNPWETQQTDTQKTTLGTAPNTIATKEVTKAPDAQETKTALASRSFSLAVHHNGQLVEAVWDC